MGFKTLFIFTTILVFVLLSIFEFNSDEHYLIEYEYVENSYEGNNGIFIDWDNVITSVISGLIVVVIAKIGGFILDSL